MKRKSGFLERVSRKDLKWFKQPVQPPTSNEPGPLARQALQANSTLVTLRHHPSLWLAPAAIHLLALLPWPYGYYILLRIVTCLVCAILVYGQWQHDRAISGWVVALGATALLYNPVLTIHLTREIWSVLNIATVGLLLGHLWALKRLLHT